MSKKILSGATSGAVGAGASTIVSNILNIGEIKFSDLKSMLIEKFGPNSCIDLLKQEFIKKGKARENGDILILDESTIKGLPGNFSFMEEFLLNLSKELNSLSSLSKGLG